MLQHLALLYAGQREFLTGVTAFIGDGVAAGEPVLVAVATERTERLRVELNGSADQIFFVTAGAPRPAGAFHPGLADLSAADVG